MKRAGIALMFVAVLGLATSAVSADTSIWFTATGAVSQGEGQALVLNTGGAGGTITVTAMGNSVPSLSGYSVDIIRTAGDTSVTAGAWMGLVPAWELTDVPGAAGDNILDGLGQAALFAAPISGVNQLFSFDLTFGPGNHDVFAGIGFNLFAPQQNVTFGASAPVNGADATAVGSAAVISIVPEPATLALLGFGVVGLIRRRR